MANKITVKGLIEMLQKVENKDRLVVMSKDGEGNSFSPFSCFDEFSYEADNTYSGEVGIEELTDVLRKDGYTEEDLIDGKPAIVLFPIN